jgi:ABC-2 type transport system permease protein
MTTEATRPGNGKLLRSQYRYQNLVFWRTPISAFFSLLFPVLLFVIFALVFGNQQIDELGISTAQYYAPSIAVFATASAAYTNLAINTGYQRDFGILKRVRGTPLPAWIYVTGKVLVAVVVGAIATATLLAIGFIFYDVRIPLSRVPAALLAFLVGAAAFAALGMLLAALTSSGESATAVAQATLLPLAFFSGNFFVAAQLPTWLSRLADIFPLKHFNEAFMTPFDPATTGLGFEWLHLAVIALWGIGAALLTARYFKWE